MTQDDQEALLIRLTELAEYFDKPQSDAQLLLYVRALDDLPIAAVLGATTVIVQTCTFFPKVAEIRALVLGDDTDSAELAWMALLREVRRTGWTGQPDLPPATIETIHGVWGGWVNLCQTLPNDGPEMLGWAKRFGSAYVATKHKLERPELIGRDEAKQLLSGLTQALGSGNGHGGPKQLPSAYRGNLQAVRGGEREDGRDGDA